MTRRRNSANNNAAQNLQSWQQPNGSFATAMVNQSFAMASASPQALTVNSKDIDQLRTNIHDSLDTAFPEDSLVTKMNLEAILQKEQLFSITRRDYPIPPTTGARTASREQIQRYIDKKEKLVGTVHLLLGPGTCSTIFDPTDSAPDIWEKVETWLENNDTVSSFDQRKKLYNLKYVDYPPMRYFTTLVIQSVNRLTRLEGQPLSDSAVVHILLEGVPGQDTDDPYHMVCSSLKRELDLRLTNPDGTMRVTPAYVIQQLILREGQLKKADKEMESNILAAQALLTQHNLLPAPAPTTLNVEVNNNNRRPPRQYPREGNNYGRQQPRQQPRNRGNNFRNQGNNNSGNFNGNNNNNYGNSYASRKNGNNKVEGDFSNFNGTCHFCHRLGHIKRFCGAYAEYLQDQLETIQANINMNNQQPPASTMMMHPAQAMNATSTPKPPEDEEKNSTEERSGDLREDQGW